MPLATRVFGTRTKGLDMKKSAIVLAKVLAAALLTAWFSSRDRDPRTRRTRRVPSGSRPATRPARRPARRRTSRSRTPQNPTLAEVMETVGHNKIAINFVWTLLAGFLVMFMQAGFAMVETGFTRAKNAAHTMCDELHGLPDRHARLLDLRLRAADGRRRRASPRSAARAPLNHEFTISLFGHTVRPVRH